MADDKEKSVTILDTELIENTNEETIKELSNNKGDDEDG
jgi:hypothetical protein